MAWPTRQEVVAYSIVVIVATSFIFMAALLPYVEWMVAHRVPRVLAVLLILATNPDPTGRAFGFYRAQGWRPTGEVQTRSGDEVLVLDPES